MAKALASGNEMTGAEIAAATGLGRSTVGKALAALGRDRWSIGHTDNGLVLEFVNAQGKDAAMGATAVAMALGRSAGAVGYCLTRLAAAGQVRQVSEKPRRYSSTTMEDCVQLGEAPALA